MSDAVDTLQTALNAIRRQRAEAQTQAERCEAQAKRWRDEMARLDTEIARADAGLTAMTTSSDAGEPQ